MLACRGLTKSFATPQGSLTVLDGINLELDHGDSLALMGESGSGKSTLMHLIAGLDDFDSGSLRFNGRELGQLSETAQARLRRERIGLIFQQFHLVPSLDVRANLALQARLAGRFDDAWCDHLLERLGLTELTGRYPEQLSGGQQQRLAIGRALAVRPDLLLADEPTGNLDERAAETVLELLMALADEHGCALMMITHSPAVAAPLRRRYRLTHGRLAEET
ncbi:ABC transporter ATP-binding protein [Kushneria phosphatilytica]|uniref:ABC transporter ATP-binding protein n=1 Tax=Kushneria phosphatilytica TaxID=657387 RepID=A0A1S1NZ27_9GAMM|nr:ABC transporter ATP-binding protein [Kushneria phosphatilytica]QEL12859.1 ABC transporter ATP-binding protein [Kushneria phosphatilytica]